MEQHHQPQGGELSPEHKAQAEQHSPQIYVASLADYNNGVLHGDWLDATQEPDELHEQIQAMLTRSQQPGAEEWAIHDHDGFCGLRIDEHESLDTVARLAAGIARHGEALAAYADWAGTDADTLEDFPDHHAGSYESVDAFVHDFAQSMGWQQQVEEFAGTSGIGAYVTIDYEALARTLEQEWHIVEGENGVHVFYP